MGVREDSGASVDGVADDDGKIQVLLRMPRDVYRQLQERAARERRTANMQAVYMLERDLAGGAV